MKNETSESARNLKIALIGLVVIVIILFIIGWVVYRPDPVVIQGSAEVSEIRVSGKIPGRIYSLLAEEGQQVKKGDTLVLLDSPEIAAKMKQAEAAEKAARSQDRKAQKGARSELIQGAYEMWQKAEVGVSIAKKSFDRVKNLYDKGVVTAQKHDEVEAQYQAAVAQAAATKSQYEMAKNGTDSEDKIAAQALVDKALGAVNEVAAYIKETALISPIDGEVSEIFPKQGELVGTGAPIMNIVDLSDIWFSFNIREDLLGDIKMGSEIEVKIPALKNQTYKLKVTYIKALANFATWKATKAMGEFDAKTFEVRAKSDKQIENLRPGMSALIE